MRCLDLGARGIKLHPRAQRFHLGRRAARSDVRARGRAARADPHPRGPRPAADRRRARAPHGGESRGAADHRPRRDRRPRCPRGRVRRRGPASSSTPPSGARSTCSTSSTASRPSRSLYASDYPYGQQPDSLLLSIAVARAAGFDSDRLRDLLGRSAERIAAASPRASRRRRTAAGRSAAALLRAIHHYLSMATPLLWTRQTDTIGVLGLALNACAERDGFQEERERIAELVACAKSSGRRRPRPEATPSESRSAGRRSSSSTSPTSRRSPHASEPSFAQAGCR